MLSITRRRADTSRPAVGSSTSNSLGSWITAVARWTSFACPTLKSLTARRNSGSRSNRSTIFATASASDLPRRPYRPPKNARFSDTRSDRYSAVRWAARYLGEPGRAPETSSRVPRWSCSQTRNSSSRPNLEVFGRLHALRRRRNRTEYPDADFSVRSWPRQPTRRGCVQLAGWPGDRNGPQSIRDVIAL